MRYSRSIVSIALAALVFAGAAQARPQAADDQNNAGAAPSFATVAKGGKWLTRGDIPKDDDSLKNLRAHFGDYDRDHNGKLDASEYAAYASGGSSQEQQRR